jgi:hypothetical protein
VVTYGTGIQGKNVFLSTHHPSPHGVLVGEDGFTLPQILWEVKLCVLHINNVTTVVDVVGFFSTK